MRIDDRVGRSIRAQDIVLALVQSTDDARYADPSALPGWSVAHVVAHLVGNCAAQARQIEYALRGELVDVYSGGQPARDAEIERRAALPPAELRARMAAEHERYAAVARRLTPDDAGRPVRYRDGTVADVVAGRWMESLVHAVDLGLSRYSWRDWDADFCVVLIDYLTERLPGGVRVELAATDADLSRVIGRGEPSVRVAAPIAALAGWLSDRGPALSDLPLGPYPRGSVRAGR